MIITTWRASSLNYSIFSQNPKRTSFRPSASINKLPNFRSHALWMFFGCRLAPHNKSEIACWQRFHMSMNQLGDHCHAQRPYLIPIFSAWLKNSSRRISRRWPESYGRSAILTSTKCQIWTQTLDPSPNGTSCLRSNLHGSVHAVVTVFKAKYTTSNMLWLGRRHLSVLFPNEAKGRAVVQPQLSFQHTAQSSGYNLINLVHTKRVVKYGCGEVNLGRADVNPAIFPKEDHVKPSPSHFPRKRMNGSATHGGDLPDIVKCVRVGKGVSLTGSRIHHRMSFASDLLADHPSLP